MKKAFVIVNTIDILEDFEQEEIKTYKLSAEDRLRHSIFTVNNIHLVSSSDDVIFLLDASELYEQYEKYFTCYSNLFYIPIQQYFPNIFSKVRENCQFETKENIILSTFLHNYQQSLSDFDYFIKITGQYFLDKSFDNIQFNSENTSKLFFKNPIQWEWDDNWGYNLIDLRHIQNDNNLRQYSPLIYAWGKEKTDKVIDILRVIDAFSNNEQGKKYDIASLMYYFTRTYELDIIETPWIINGWNNITKNFCRF